MKCFKLMLFVSVLFLLKGCIKDKIDSCENKLILEFEHRGKLGTDILLDAINKVDVFIFDESNELVYKRQIDRKSLSTSREVLIEVNPGKYRIICWANANDNSVFEKNELGSNLTDLHLNNNTLNNHNIINGDPLYYYSTDIDISSPEIIGETLKKIIPFCKAHIKVEVFIKGFEDASKDKPDLTPIVELTNLSTDYNFNKRTTKDNITAINKTTYTTINGDTTAIIDFYTATFTEDTNAELLIRKQSDNSIITTVSLKDFIKKNNIDLQTCFQPIVPISIEYKGTEVAISLPTWETVQVKPDL